MMNEVICILCPVGCLLKVDEDGGVTGNSCPRGEAYGREEVQNPTRVVTSTVRVSGGTHRRCPVRTASAIPKRLIPEAMRLLDGAELAAPIDMGQVVVADICGTGVPFVTTRGLNKK